MSESSSQDKWGELARNLGAEVREEPKESSAEIEVTGKPRPSVPRAAPRVPSAPPRRPSAGWDQLGSEFGLPTPQEEPRKPPVETTEAPAVRNRDKPPREAKPERKVERHRDQSERRESRQPDRSEPPRAREERRKPRVAERRQVQEETAVEQEQPGEVVELHTQQSPSLVRPKPEPPVIEPPRSGYGLPDWFPFARKREAPPPPPAVNEPPAPAYEEVEVEEVYEVEATETLDDVEERQPDRDVDEDESRRGKRRRPRRRRRGGKSKDEAAEKPRAKSSTPVESIVVDLGPAGHDVELFEDDDEEETGVAESDHDEESEEEESGSARPASHRNIPSWGEAIGVVVEANLATRSERKKSARSANSQGGRTRGRRKKRS